MAQTVELDGEALEVLLSYQRDDEDLSETAERVVPALVPHGINFDDVGIDHETLDSDTRFVLERWPEAGGHVGATVYKSITRYLRAHKKMIDHTTFRDEGTGDETAEQMEGAE